MKITASEKGIEASGKIRGQKGNAGISEDGIVELGLDIKVAEIGISTDYGGSIIVGFAGQKIVWGLEGGRLLIKFGGIFEVEVEARDCVVTETKKIAGQIVASRTYPDPGCKFPPEPTPTPDPDPTPTPIPAPYGEKPPLLPPPYYPKGTKKFCKIAVSVERKSFSWEGDYNGDPPYQFGDNNSWISTVNGGYDENNILTGTVSYKKDIFHLNLVESNPGPYNYRIKNEFNLIIPVDPYPDRINPYHYGKLEVRFIGGESFELKGDEQLIYDYLQARHHSISGQVAPNGYWDFYEYVNTVECKITANTCVPKIKQPSQFPSPSPGNRPPMSQTCCEALKADIEDIKTVLATKEMLAKKLTFPWRTRIAGGTGNEIIEDYPNLLRAIAQQIDHLGIHPPKLSVKDLNNAIAGDQGLENQFPSATQGFEALMAQIWDVNGDVDTLTNFLYRLSWLCVQQSMNLARLSGDIKAIKDMCGGECEPVEATLTTPFNISAGTENSTRGKGFAKKGGDKIDNRIDLNTEKATEELLPDFLRVRDNNLVIERFSGDKDIFDLLTIIILKLEKLNS
ncbi:hypothetical protein [Microcoleus anatoxicus]|uniref:Uncharacterized protein n=1 Tax=Microcoleus anatoxicus PTRS2 TaxID=2705321 RepID=A0ABU8YQ30_9CYAN